MNKRTLFLDRDGVINHRIVGSYVRKWSEFEFMEGTLEALNTLKKYFSPIFVVTNQQGIAKGVMTEQDLQLLHTQMKEKIEKAGGVLDAIYYCKEHERENPPCRKPNIGMALQAQKDFPVINLNNAVMVGDSISDIEFGLRLDMQTVLITTKEDIDTQKLEKIKPQINYTCSSLLEFAQIIDCNS